MNDVPVDGRQLLGWINRQPGRDELDARAKRLGCRRRYPRRIIDWDRDQVADIWHELTDKAPKGSQHWGGTGPTLADAPDRTG